MVWSGDGQRLLVAGSEEIRSYLTAALDGPSELLVAGDINTVVLHPNGALLALGRNDGVLEWYDLTSRTVIETQKVYETRVDSVAFSPDGLMLASGGFEKSFSGPHST